MTEDGKVTAEPAPHGRYDDNTRRTGGESRPQGDIPAPCRSCYRTGRTSDEPDAAIQSRLSMRQKCNIKKDFHRTPRHHLPQIDAPCVHETPMPSTQSAKGKSSPRTVSVPARKRRRAVGCGDCVAPDKRRETRLPKLEDGSARQGVATVSFRWAHLLRSSVLSRVCILHSGR